MLISWHHLAFTIETNWGMSKNPFAGMMHYTEISYSNKHVVKGFCGCYLKQLYIVWCGCSECWGVEEVRCRIKEAAAG